MAEPEMQGDYRCCRRKRTYREAFCQGRKEILQNESQGTQMAKKQGRSNECRRSPVRRRRTPASGKAKDRVQGHAARKKSRLYCRKKDRKEGSLMARKESSKIP